jgi:IclR family acetate operon transcriptional repressor
MPIQSVERALLILDAVAREETWVGVREIARRTGLKAPTAQQLLKTLQNRAYLEFDPQQRKYRIGLAAALLARGGDPLAKLGDFIRPHLDRLFEAYGETVLALTYRERAFRIAACRPSLKLLTVIPPPAGAVVEQPLAWASGRLLLAAQPEEVQRQYAQDAEALEHLRRIATAGFAETRDLEGSGVVALAVLVRRREEPLLALGWSVPLCRFTNDLRARVLTDLREVAAAAEQALA